MNPVCNTTKKPESMNIMKSTAKEYVSMARRNAMNKAAATGKLTLVPLCKSNVICLFTVQKKRKPARGRMAAYPQMRFRIFLPSIQEVDSASSSRTCLNDSKSDIDDLNSSHSTIGTSSTKSLPRSGTMECIPTIHGSQTKILQPVKIDNVRTKGSVDSMQFKLPTHELQKNTSSMKKSSATMLNSADTKTVILPNIANLSASKKLSFSSHLVPAQSSFPSSFVTTPTLLPGLDHKLTSRISAAGSSGSIASTWGIQCSVALKNLK